MLDDISWADWSGTVSSCSSCPVYKGKSKATLNVSDGTESESVAALVDNGWSMTNNKVISKAETDILNRGNIDVRSYSHSMVAGGFELISYTTRFTPLTLLMISLETFPRNSKGKWHQSAVIPSVEVTARRATTFS